MELSSITYSHIQPPNASNIPSCLGINIPVWYVVCKCALALSLLTQFLCTKYHMYIYIFYACAWVHILISVLFKWMDIATRVLLLHPTILGPSILHAFSSIINTNSLLYNCFFSDSQHFLSHTHTLNAKSVKQCKLECVAIYSNAH